MKVGVKLPNSGPFATADGIRTVAVECERLGYDSLWVHDHVHRTMADARSHFVAGSIRAWDDWPGSPVPNVFEAVNTLSYCAGLTTRMQLGTSIIVLPLRNPVWLAKYMACLDHFCGGRAILGVGVGGAPYVRAETEAIGGVPLEKGRGRFCDEWIEIIRAIWREPRVDHVGEFLTVRGAEVYPKPVDGRNIPIVWGGASAPAKRRIALSLDGWLPMFLSPDDLRDGIQDIHAQAKEAGRDPSAITAFSEHWLSIGEDRELATARANATRREILRYTGDNTEDTQETMRVHMKERGEHSLVGDPDWMAARVREYEAAGADHLILRVIADSLDQMVDSLGMFKERVWDVAAAAH